MFQPHHHDQQQQQQQQDFGQTEAIAFLQPSVLAEASQEMIIENESSKDAIDEETINLFALMNSSIVELQIEMEMLENKEYEKDDIEIEHPQTGTDRAGSSKENSSEQKPAPTSHNTSAKVQETTSSSTSTTAAAATTLTKKPKSVEWQAMEPAKVGDEDYSPVSDYSPGKAVVIVAGVEERQDDSSDRNSKEEPYHAVSSLEPAKVGDLDYTPVSDYTNTATVETIANAMSKAVSKANTRGKQQSGGLFWNFFADRGRKS